MNPLFSIVILTRNSLKVIDRLVGALLEQEFDHPYEVIFMDNNSSDGTPEYLARTPFPEKQIIHVPEGEFSHSGTRMRATEAARGKYMIFFTDDIIPQGKLFLCHLAKPLLENRAAAAYGVWQIDAEKCDPIDAYLHNSWYVAIDDIVEPISPFCWEKFTPELKRRLCNFDNCSSCIDSRVLLELRFPDVPYGEDMLFAKKLILSNFKVAICKEARFFHWHKVSFTYLMKRMCVDQYLSIPEYGIYYVRRKLGVIKAILLRVAQRTFIAFFKLKIPLGKRFYWAFYNTKTLTADFIGKYMGVLTEESARGFSPINKRLLDKKKRIIDEVYRRSIHRY